MIKITSETANNIRLRYDNRFSATYYHLAQQMDTLNKQGVEIHTIADICKSIDSGSYIDEYVPNGTRYIRVGDLKKYVVDISESAFIPSKKQKNKMILSKGDVCFARTQATYDKLGNFTLIDDLNDGDSISQHVSKIKPTKYVSSEYLVAYLNSKFGKKQMCIASYGDTRVELTHNQTKEIKVILLDEDIVSIIEDKVKKLMKCHNNANVAFKKSQDIIDKEFYGIKQSSSLSVTTKQMLIENNLWSPSCYAPKYVETINKIKNNFKSEKLSRLISFIKKGVEVGSENYLIELEKGSSDLPFVRTSDIYNNEIDYAPDYFVTADRSIAAKCPELLKDDIIFSKDGKIGQVGIINKDNSVVPSSGFAIMRSNGTVSSDYLFAILSHKEIVINQGKMKTVIAATIPHLKIDKINEFNIPIFSESVILEIESNIKVFRENVSKKQQLIVEIQDILNSSYNELLG